MKARPFTDRLQRGCRQTLVHVPHRYDQKPHRLAIKPVWKQVRELDNKAPKLPWLKDTGNCLMDVPAVNVSMTEFHMCTLLMFVVSDKIADEYDYSHD